MTEAEWLGADSALGMLGWLCEGRHYLRQGPVGDRKLRLFACACCRAAWHLLRDDASRHAVGAAERHADGRMSAVEFALATGAAKGGGGIAGLAWQCTWPGAEECAWNAVHRLRCDGRLPRVDTAALLREVVGNPFRAQLEMASGIRHDPVPLAWLTPEALAVARGGYDERLPAGALDPERLAVLADALEDGGCAEEALLRHLRGEECVFVVLPGGLQSNRPVLWRKLPVPHYRGCWALDLVLGLS